MASELQRVLDYHERTAHRPGRYAASLGYLDWDTQPNPFRLYDGAERLVLPRPAHVPGDSPTYADLFRGRLPADALDLDLLGSLFFPALALSAWQQHGSSRWSLRVNPSTANPPPTELTCSPARSPACPKSQVSIITARSCTASSGAPPSTQPPGAP